MRVFTGLYFLMLCSSALLGSSHQATKQDILSSGAHTDSVLLAKKPDKPNKKANKAEKKSDNKNDVKQKTRFLTTEGKAKANDRRRIDFDAVDVTGERKTPLATMINQSKADKDYDLIKIRLRWHPEMIESTSSLETGSSK